MLEKDVSALGSDREFEWDAFISHASEDKDAFVRELAYELTEQGLRVWYDEFVLTVGDSIRRSIDKGLTNSRYGIVVLSPNFFAKGWPQEELDGLATRDYQGPKVILPVWLDVELEEVKRYSLPLAGRYAAKAINGIESVISELLNVLKPAARTGMSRRDEDRYLGQLGDFR